MTPHPPRPRLTLRVGITGHRPNKLRGPAVPRIERQLRQVFAAIEAAAADILAGSGDCYAREPFAVRLVSGFAEGADQMASAACPADWQVEAILPFPKHEYLKDFVQSAAGDGRDVGAEFEASLAKAHAVTELAYPAPAASDGRGAADSRERDKAYADAGGHLLRQIDVLVAIWDGAPPKTGGTGAVARKAFEGGIPVVWLSTCDELPPRLIRGFDAAGGPVAPDTDCTRGPLRNALEPIFALPADAQRNSKRTARAALAEYYAEDWPACCYFPVYDMLRRFANGQRLRHVIRSRPFADLCRDWDAFLADAPEADNLRAPLREVLIPRYVWADALAVHFSHHYRSAYVLAYVLAALAVFIALGGLFVESLGAKAGFVAAELLVIGAIIGMILHGRRRRWHERWLEYRALAESLRHGRFLAFVSEFGRIHDASPAPSSRGSSWMLWYLRATTREIGLPTATLDAAYQWRILDATLLHELRDQVRYHAGNSKSAQRTDDLLHRLGVICFSITFVILAVFLCGYLVHLVLASVPATAGGPVAAFLLAALTHLKGAIIFFSAGLPALGAALAGIRVHGDFEGSMERSDHMQEALASLELDYLAAKDSNVRLEDTAAMLISTARIMSDDVDAWQELYGRKRLTLPA